LVIIIPVRDYAIVAGSSIDQYVGNLLRTLKTRYKTVAQMENGVMGAAGKCGYSVELSKGDMSHGNTSLGILQPGIKRMFGRPPNKNILHLTYDPSQELQIMNITIEVYNEELAREFLRRLNQ